MESRDIRWLTLKNGQPVQEAQPRRADQPADESYRPSPVLFVFPRAACRCLSPPISNSVLASDSETLPDQTRKLSFVLDLPDVKVVKTFSFPPKSLQIGFTVDVENKRARR